MTFAIIRRAALACCLALAAGLHTTASAGDGDALNDQLEDILEWRCIGPSRGGRATTVAGVPGDPMTYYMGPSGGGVWKTTNAGLTWQPITDGEVNTGSVGAVAVAPSDPNVLYVGMGERDIRGNFSHGDGVYKSLNAGKTWTHIGLDDTRQIGKIRVHPNNPDLVYVAALGHIFGPNDERGVYRSNDGGSTWERVLFVDEHTGAIDIAMDPNNPRVLYAGFWQVSRTPWSLSSGGEGSGIFKSTDGGDTWDELTDGLPEGITGKSSISVSAVNSERVYAIIEADDGGVFRSEDAGETWKRVNEERKLRQRAWYYTHIIADPNQEDTVYVMNVRFHKSTDGGRTWESIGVPHGDNHDLWINPENSRNMVNANDGGANVTFDGGQSWTRQDGQATAQFYRVTVDNQYPYRVLGAQQDNSTCSISSRNRTRPGERFHAVGGGESGYIAVHPDNPDIIYAGSYDGYLTRYDHSTGLSRNITVWPDNPMGHGVENMKFRFQWTFPIVISPHNPDTLYVGSHVVLKSTNEGQSWEAISPDLTTNDVSKQGPSGGPITKDNTSVEYYCTIFTIAESPLRKDMIWVGSDDGLVHLTTDGGANWSDVTPSNLPESSIISLIEASPHDADTAYMAVTRYKMDDFAPYLYRTHDAGRTWTRCDTGIEGTAFTRSIREDTTRPGMLYAATETGVYLSMNDGDSWEKIQLNLPVVPVTDVAVKDDDLVIATQGRSFWILDGLDTLRQLAGETPAGIALLDPQPVFHNSFESVALIYHLPERDEDVDGPDVAIRILDSAGTVIRAFGVDDETDPGNEPEDDDSGADNSGNDIPNDAGFNRFEWNTRYEDAVTVPGAVMWGGGTRGPAAAPGTYTARVTIDSVVHEAPIVIKPDPRLDASDADYTAQFDLLLRIREATSQVHRGVNTVRSVRQQIKTAVARANEAGDATDVVAASKSLTSRLDEIEEALIQRRSKSPQDPLNYPIRLNDKISNLAGVVSRSLGAPTEQAYAVLADLMAQARPHLSDLDRIVTEDIPQFNALVEETRIPAVIIKDE